MQIPFTAEQFLQVFKQYNETIWPSQIMLYLFALLAVFFSFIKGKHSQKIISTILSLMWIWMGVVYHLLYFSSINKAAYIFGGAFILQEILFFIFYFFKKTHISRCLLLLAMPMVINSF